MQSGAIGEVGEVHVLGGDATVGQPRPTETPPVPAALHYDLWLGPVPYVPYSPEYVPFKWRNWWAFGGGALADFGCHFMDLPHWALGLRTVTSAEVVEGPPVNPDSCPPWLILRYEYPARGSQPPVKLTWYHRGKQPPPPLLPKELADQWKGGVLFVGSKGVLLSDYGRHRFIPEREGFVAPARTIPDSVGHHAEWIRACKTGSPTTCNFDYSGALDGNGAAGQRGLPGRQPDRMGLEGAAGRALPPGGRVHPPPLPGRVEDLRRRGDDAGEPEPHEKAAWGR